MLVCTLPSPACMCRATNTRPCSTRLCTASQSASTGANAAPTKMRARSARTSVFQLTRMLRSCSRSKMLPDSSCRRCEFRAHRNWRAPRGSGASMALEQVLPAGADARQQLARFAFCGRGRHPRSCPDRSRREKYSSSASSNSSLLRIDSSILMRSMASVYSPRRSSGMTTSSLILNALVCLAMAAVLARSSQNLRRASALTAMNPSPARALAMRTTCEVAAATAASSSPTMSPSSTIFGNAPRLDLVL